MSSKAYFFNFNKVATLRKLLETILAAAKAYRLLNRLIGIMIVDKLKSPWKGKLCMDILSINTATNVAYRNDNFMQI